RAAPAHAARRAPRAPGGPAPRNAYSRRLGGLVASDPESRDAFPTRCEDPRLLEGLRLLLARRWYDAHEALEGPWGELEPGPWREVLQGLIQQCVALEHLRRDNALGAFNVWS